MIYLFEKECVLRVTAGKYKGRTLIENKYSHIRPTADMVKQAIFNKLAFRLPNSKILDLFAGTGALGIEGISRNAQEVVFVDKDPRSAQLVRDNLKRMGEDARVIKADYAKAIESLRGEKFDIILLDPPYKSGFYENAVRLIAENDLLAEDGVIVCEHDKTDKFDFSPFAVEDEKIYGTKMVTFLKKSLKE